MKEHRLQKHDWMEIGSYPGQNLSQESIFCFVFYLTCDTAIS